LVGAPPEPLPEVAFDLAAMFRQVAPPDGAETEALRRATATAPEFDRLLEGSIALRALLAQDQAG
jgi:hypothetical protein